MAISLQDRHVALRQDDGCVEAGIDEPQKLVMNRVGEIHARLQGDR